MCHKKIPHALPRRLPQVILTLGDHRWSKSAGQAATPSPFDLQFLPEFGQGHATCCQDSGMWTAFATIVDGIAGLVIGYLIRLNEFRRDRCLIAYSEFIGAFLAAAHAGAALFSARSSMAHRPDP